MKVIFYCTDDFCNGQMGTDTELEFNTLLNTAVGYGEKNHITIYCDTCDRKATIKITSLKKVGY